MAKRISVGLIGAGRIGIDMRARLHSSREMPSSPSCDVNETSARSLALDCQCDRWALDPYSVISDPSIDAVIVASSTDSHAPLIAAAAAGKYVLREAYRPRSRSDRPRALSCRTSWSQAANRFQRRFDNAYHQAKTMVAEGKVGRVEAIRESMRDPNRIENMFQRLAGFSGT